MDIKPIKNERDYEKALRRAESLWKSPEGSAESDELDILATLIEAYENEHYPSDMPDPVEAMRALIGVIGGRTRVYEVLRGKRSLSLNMIRELHDKFGIPANVLIQPGRKRGKSTGRHTSRRLGSATLKKSA